MALFVILTVLSVPGAMFFLAAAIYRIRNGYRRVGCARLPKSPKI